MQSKLAAIILVALAFVAGAWLWLSEQQSPSDDSVSGQRLFPVLEQKLNDISRIRVEHDGSVYAVVKKDDQWQLPDRGGYPVLFTRVKPLLLGLARLEKIEPKTGKPENYARLGVQAPSADNTSTRLGLYTTEDQPVASLIIGKVTSGLISGGRDGIYARVSGESRSWLVAGNLDLPAAPVNWVDRQIIHIKPKRVQRVSITHPDGDSLVVEKSHRVAANYTLVNASANAASKDSAELNSLARSLAGLKMDDVLVRSTAGVSETGAVKTVFETWDGLQITVWTTRQGHKILAWFDVDDPELRSRLDGWLYEIPRSRGDKLRARLADLGNAVTSLP